MKIVLIDAYSLIYKAYFGVRPMHSADGTPTNAIYGFMNMLLKLNSDEAPDMTVAAFDFSKVTFRTEMFTEYKAGRESMPEELSAQLPIIMDILQRAGVKILKKEGYEADDIIGSISKQASENGIEAIIVTGDRDSFQLVMDNVEVHYAKKGVSDIVIVNEDYIMENYKVTPPQLIDIKALMGDKSDNIPGVKGIGEKTAISLIESYGSVDGVYENIDLIKGKNKEKLLNEKETAYLSRALAEIDRTLDMGICFEAVPVNYSDRGIIDILTNLQMKNLLAKLDVKSDGGAVSEEKEEKIEFEVCETADFGRFRGKTVGCWLNDVNPPYVLAVNDGEKTYLYPEPDQDTLNGFYLDEDIKKYTFNLKHLIKSLYEKGTKIEGAVLDIMIAAYVLNSNDEKYTIDMLTSRYLGRELSGGNDKSGQLSMLDMLNSDKQYAAVAEKAAVVGKIGKILTEKLIEENCDSLYYDIEHKLIYVLADMETEGFSVDKRYLEDLDKVYDKRIDDLTSTIRSLAGKDESFNINSTKQLGALLFEELKLPVIKKTKTGYSTDIEVLEALYDSHPIIPMIIELRQISKLSSTYVKGLIKLIDPKTGKIHTTFNQTVTVTGRLSSSNPNLQNIPVRTEEGREIRKVFVASNHDRVLIDADYSQIELRVLSHIAEDERMIEAFRNEEDIHTATASEVFGIAPMMVTKEQRSRAKAVNFGIVYGISDFGLAKDLGIARNKAKKYIETYFERFPGVKSYMDGIIESAKKEGYVTTIFGRKRYIPDILSKNKNIRQFGERTAMNTPIQGSAADIIKLAMIRVYEKLKESGSDAKLILQVHDELIIDCAVSDVIVVKEMLREEMENAAKLSVPLTADINCAYSWFDGK
ncbi:MAG: DNA polymerase I [Eubacteriaceae bacterium]|nr:DNA polymerase I [Eubacteriaceae bacterium]